MLANPQSYSPSRYDDHFNFLMLKIIYTVREWSGLVYCQVQNERFTLNYLIPWHFAFLVGESLLKGWMSSLQDSGKPWKVHFIRKWLLAHLSASWEWHTGGCQGIFLAHRMRLMRMFSCWDFAVPVRTDAVLTVHSQLNGFFTSATQGKNQGIKPL